MLSDGPVRYGIWVLVGIKRGIAVRKDIPLSISPLDSPRVRLRRGGLGGKQTIRPRWDLRPQWACYSFTWIRPMGQTGALWAVPPSLFSLHEHRQIATY